MNTADKIRKFRIDNAMRQSDLADKSGFARNTISRWERGLTVPSKEDLEIISQALNVPYEMFNDTTEDDYSATNLENPKLYEKMDDLIMAIEDMKLELVTVSQLKKTMRRTVFVILISMILFLILIYCYGLVMFDWPAKSSEQPAPVVEYISEEG